MWRNSRCGEILDAEKLYMWRNRRRRIPMRRKCLQICVFVGWEMFICEMIMKGNADAKKMFADMWGRWMRNVYVRGSWRWTLMRRRCLQICVAIGRRQASGPFSPASGSPARWNNAAAGDTSGGEQNMRIWGFEYMSIRGYGYYLVIPNSIHTLEILYQDYSLKN